MNIFILDKDPKQSVKYYTNSHTIKMILEHVQVLSAVLHKTNQSIDGIYKLTHKNHPCTIWAGESIENFNYLIELTEALGEEYTFRYGKHHKSLDVLSLIKQANITLPSKALTPFAQAMPEQYRDKDAVVAYRNYYKNEKQKLFQWKNRDKPHWI